MIRAILLVILIFVLLILFLPALLILMIYRNADPLGAHKAAQFLARLIMKMMIAMTGSTVSVKGLENIPKDTPVLFVSNHRGSFDIFLGYSYITKPYGWVAKKEFWDILYVIRRWMQILHCIFLKRKDPKAGMEMILQSVEHIKNGISMWICPEGTRNRGGGRIGLLMFHNGSFKIASRAGVPVVPVAVYGTRELLEANGSKIKPSKLAIYVGKPEMISDLSEEDQKNVGDYFQGVVGKLLLQIDEDMGYGEEGRYE